VEVQKAEKIIPYMFRYRITLKLKIYLTIWHCMNNSSLLTLLSDDTKWTKKTTANARKENDQKETTNCNADDCTNAEIKM